MSLPWQISCFFALMIAVADWSRMPETWQTIVTAGPAGPTLRVTFWIAAALIYCSLLP